MPSLLKQTEIVLQWEDLNRRKDRKSLKSSTVRPPGYHLSSVIRTKLQHDGKLAQDDITDEMPLRMAMGMAWENWTMGLWPEIRWQPGAVEKDDIWGSVDGLSEAVACAKCGLLAGDKVLSLGSCPCGGKLRRELMVEEFKLTWKSEYTHPFMQENIWLWQVAGYCHMHDARLARFHVGWVNGNYRPPSPKYMLYVVRYEDKELGRFWGDVILPWRDRSEPESGERV